ncbi:MAG: GNAT family N-acetyltransferase [Legionellaceae bacterium]|nr:GNAT family N-acetyltransferase [Legionellaceae bacterium]
MEFVIRPITLSDADGFQAAVDSVARERRYLAFLEGPSIEMSKTFILNNLKGNWPHVVAVHNGQIIGWCDITSLNRPVFAHSGSLGVGVLKSYRRQGVGKALMTTALKKAQEKGLTRIELTVREHNTSAIALYEKLGFIKEGVHKSSVCIDGVYENHVFMALLYI